MQAQETGRLVHEIINRDQHRALNELVNTSELTQIHSGVKYKKSLFYSQLALFSRQIAHFDQKLTCGMFEFDWTFFMLVSGGNILQLDQPIRSSFRSYR